jgi:hypothetical protein
LHAAAFWDCASVERFLRKQVRDLRIRRQDMKAARFMPLVNRMLEIYLPKAAQPMAPIIRTKGRGLWVDGGSMAIPRRRSNPEGRRCEIVRQIQEMARKEDRA